MATLFDPCLRPNLAQTINVAVRSGVTSSGDATYGAATAVLARVEPKRKTMTNAAGEVVVSEFAIYTEALIGLYDRIWLPGDLPTDPTKARAPLKVYDGIDEYGTTSHYEVWV